MAVMDRIAELEQRFVFSSYFCWKCYWNLIPFFLICQGDKGEVGMRGLDGNPGIKVHVHVLYFITCKDDYCVLLLSWIEWSNHFIPDIVSY